MKFSLSDLNTCQFLYIQKPALENLTTGETYPTANLPLAKKTCQYVHSAIKYAIANSETLNQHAKMFAFCMRRFTASYSMWKHSLERWATFAKYRCRCQEQPLSLNLFIRVFTDTSPIQKAPAQGIEISKH